LLHDCGRTAGGEVHNIDFNLDALRAIGIPVVDRAPAFPDSEAARAFADEFFFSSVPDSRPAVALDPGALVHQTVEDSPVRGAWLTVWPRISIIVLVWGPASRQIEQIECIEMPAFHTASPSAANW